MDVRQVLQSTLAADTAVRTNAEQQLAHAAEVDFVCPPCPPPHHPHMLLETCISDLDADTFVI